MLEFLSGINFCLHLIYLVSSDTTMTCFFFFLIVGTRFGASDSIKLTRTHYCPCYPVGHHAEIESFFVSFCLFDFCLCITSLQQLRSFRDGATA